MDDDDWQEMPVVASGSGPRKSLDPDTDSDSDAGPSRSGYQRQGASQRKHVAFRASSSRTTTTNATGRTLGVKDARGYDWRSKPSNAPIHHAEGGDWETTQASVPERNDDQRLSGKRQPCRQRTAPG